MLPGEATPATEALLDAVGAAGALVPALWPIETANVLLQAERRGRIATAERLQAVDILQALPLRIDHLAPPAFFGAVSGLAQAQGLTIYDACYLDLAIRAGLPLATLDTALGQAARRVGIGLILPPPARSGPTA